MNNDDVSIKTADDSTYAKRYFDALYDDNSDPWQYQTRWYEQRKREMCLSILPQPQYNRAIEMGCGNGVFTERLADRCQSLVSIDGNDKAVQLAKRRVAPLSDVKVIQGVIPTDLFTLQDKLAAAYPVSPHSLAQNTANQDTAGQNTANQNMMFDLIIISEILYYLSADDIEMVIDWIGAHLADGGTVLCCHWRYKIDGFAMTGETVHQRLHQAFRPDSQSRPSGAVLTHQSQIVDKDFLLDVWQNMPQSVAMQESLV